MFLCSVQFSFAQSYVAGLNKQANQMVNCFKTGDYACLLSFTHPKIVKAMGGSKLAEEKLAQQMTNMKQQGAEFSKIAVEPVLQHLVSGKTIQCVVPQIVEVKYLGQVVKSKTYLFGISYNNGKNWYFIDAGSQSPEKIRQFLPEISKKIVIPKKERS